MKKLMLLIGFSLITVYLNGQDKISRKPSTDNKPKSHVKGIELANSEDFVLVKSLELANAGDFVLDVNDFEYAKSALEYYNMPIDEKATEAAAELGELLGNKDYRDGISTHATLKILRTTNDKTESFFFGVLDAKPSKLLHKTIERLFFSMGKVHHEKFIHDLTTLGYRKVKTEDVKFDFIGVRPQTTYQNGNKICKVFSSKDGSTLWATFERSKEEMSEEEDSIAHECRLFLSLEVNKESPTVIGSKYLQSAEVDLAFPNENTIISIPYDVLEGKDKELENMHRSGTFMGWEMMEGADNSRRMPIHALKQFIINSDGELDIDLKKIPGLSSRASKRLRAQYKMENALAEWIAPNITVTRPATIYFPRFSKEYKVNSALMIEIHESKDDIDTCRIHLNIKRKGYYGNYEYTIKNSKEIMPTLSEVYKNEDVLPSLIESLKQRMDNYHLDSNKFDIDVYAYRHSVKFSYKDKSATYKLPLIFEWGKPQE